MEFYNGTRATPGMLLEHEKFITSVDYILYNAGYVVTCEVNGDTLTFSTKYNGSEDDAAHMPQIDLEFIDNDDYWSVCPTLTFPQLTFNDDDYADTIHYWLSKWESVGKTITTLNKYVFDPIEYLASLDEED